MPAGDATLWSKQSNPHRLERFSMLDPYLLGTGTDTSRVVFKAALRSRSRPIVSNSAANRDRG